MTLETISTAVDERNGTVSFFVPTLEIGGAPAKAKINPVALRPENGARLWELSEEMTGIRYLSEDHS